MITFISERNSDLSEIIGYFDYNFKKKDCITVGEFMNHMYNAAFYIYDPIIVENGERVRYICYSAHDYDIRLWTDDIIKNVLMTTKDHVWKKDDFKYEFDFNKPIENIIEHIDENTDRITNRWKPGFHHSNYWYVIIPEPKESE